MTSNAKYIAIAVMSVLIMSLFILFAPVSESGKKKEQDTVLWERSWEYLEYFPGKETGEATGKGTKKEPEGNKPANPSGIHLSAKPLGFYRKGGFYRDEFAVDTIGAGEKKISRRAGNTVKNIFTQWSRLTIKDSYDVKNDGIQITAKKSVKLTELGLDENSPRLLLYAKRGGQALELKFGKKLKSGKIFFQSSLPTHRGRIFGISAFAAERFKQPALQYRERQFLYYPSKSYTTRLTVRGATGKKTVLNQRQKAPDKAGKVAYEWSDETGRNIPLNIATPLENFIKQIRIGYFNDEAKVKEFGDAAKLWDDSKTPETVIEVRVKNGGAYLLRLKEPAGELKLSDGPYILIRSGLDDFTDYVPRSRLDNIKRQLEKLENFKKRPSGSLKQGKPAGPVPYAPIPGGKTPGGSK